MALGAALASSEGEKFASAWNFGPNPADVFTVTDLVETIVRVWGSGAWRANTDLDAPHEAGLLRLSIDKATSRLGWRPVWSFEETITRTIRWYSRYLASPEDCSATYASCVADIAAYESAACEKGVAWAQQGIGAAARS
jgi:CDP-glucose 4,6-dehydratase